MFSGGHDDAGPPTLTHARNYTKPLCALAASLAALLLTGAVPRAARAQLGVSAGVSVGGTNNATSATTEGQGAEADGFTRTSLGATYQLRTPRSTHQFSYLFGAYFYMASGQSVSINNDLGWTGTVSPTAFSELGLTLTLSQGRTNDLDLFNRQAGGVESVARPAGAETFLSAGAGQSLTWTLSPFWSVGENVNANIYQPISEGTQQPRTIGADAGLTLNRLFIEDSLGLFVRAGHGRSEAVVVDGAELYPARRANYGEAGLGYTHAFNEDWTAYLGGGLLAVQVPQIRDPFLDFSVHGTLTHLTSTGGDITLRVDRGVYTNVYVGDVLLQNSIGLQGSHPFGLRESWLIGGSVDYQRSESLFVVDVKESGLNIFHTAATVTYDWTRHRRLAFELSYTYQDSGQSVRMGMIQEAFTLHRAMAMLTLEFVFPEPEERPTRRRGRSSRRSGGGGGGDAPGPTGGDGGEGGVPAMGTPVRGSGKSLPSAPRGDGAQP
jgi:hypothetical protein